MEEEKITLRQRWFPTPDDAENIDYEKGIHNSSGVIQFFKRWIRSLALVGVLGWGSCQGIGNSIDYAEGDRVGVVNKLSEKGLFLKTTEGQLSLEGRTSTGAETGAGVWDFSLDRQAGHGEDVDALREKIRACMEQGKRTKLRYIEQGATWPWRAETDHLVQDVECPERQE